MEEYWYLAPIVGFALLLFFRGRDQRGLLAPGALLTGLYLGSAVTALLLRREWLPQFRFQHSPEAVIAYTLLIAMCLWPGLRMRRPHAMPSRDDAVARLLVHASIPLIWFALLYQMPYAIEGVRAGALATRAAQDNEGIFILPESPWTTLAVAVSQYYVVFVVLFFWSLVDGRSRFVTLSMLAGSTLYFVSSLCFTARDGVVWLALSLAWGYWTWKPWLSDRARRAARVVGLALVAGAVPFFVSFTVDRVAGSRAFGLTDSLIAYFGSQPYVFCEAVAEQEYFYGMHLRFPLIQSLVGELEPIRRTRQYEWTFGTFLRDFYGVAGWPSAIGLCLLFAGYFWRVVRSADRIDPLRLLLLQGFYFQFMSQGVFYFRLGNRAGNVYMASLAILSVFLWLTREPARAAEARAFPPYRPSQL